MNSDPRREAASFSLQCRDPIDPDVLTGDRKDVKIKNALIHRSSELMPTAPVFCLKQECCRNHSDLF